MAWEDGWACYGACGDAGDVIQFVMNYKRLRFFEKDTVDWSGPSLAPFYTALFDLKERAPALGNGPWGGAQTKLMDRSPAAVDAVGPIR